MTIFKISCQWISESNRVILASGPEKEAVLLPTEDQLAAVFKGVEESEIAAYVDEVRDAPLLAQIPEPGKIVERTEIPEIGVRGVVFPYKEPYLGDPPRENDVRIGLERSHHR